MHARTSIRKRIASMLKNSTSFELKLKDRIYDSKVYPIDASPAIVIYTPAEQVIDFSIGYPRSQTRQLNLNIEIYTKENGAIDQISDSLCLEIEAIISADPTLGGMVKDTTLSSSETILSGDGDKPIAIATLNYNIIYRTKETSPNQLI